MAYNQHIPIRGFKKDHRAAAARSDIRITATNIQAPTDVEQSFLLKKQVNITLCVYNTALMI
jgi:hypothetical protein